MPQKLFVLGLPGSGKSTIARYIVGYIQRNHPEWIATRFNDYDILHDMFLHHQTQKYFSPTAHKGFRVKDESVYNSALKQLQQAIESGNYPEDELIVIEFARSDYISAFRNFSPAFLQDAFFLFLDVSVDMGMKRVKNRVKHPRSTDDHFVPKHTFDVYDQKEFVQNLPLVVQDLTLQYGLQPQKVKILKNGSSKRRFEKPVATLIKRIRYQAFKNRKVAMVEVTKGISGN